MYVPCLYMLRWLKVTIQTRILARHLEINSISYWLLSEVHTWGSSSNFPSCLFHHLMALYFLPHSSSGAAVRSGGGGWNSLVVHCSRDGHTSFCPLRHLHEDLQTWFPVGKIACLHLLRPSRFCRPEEGLRVWRWLTARMPLFFSAFHVHSAVASSWQPSPPSNL